MRRSGNRALKKPGVLIVRQGVSYLQVSVLVVLALLFSVLIVYHQVEKTELSAEIASLEARYDELVSKGRLLSAELELLYNGAYLEKNVRSLGMGPAQEYQTEYISVHRGDTISRSHTRAESIIASIIGVFQSVKEYLFS